MFQWFTAWTYVDDSKNQKLLTSILQSIRLIQYSFLYVFFIFETKLQLINILHFKGSLSLYQGHLFKFSDFPRQTVTSLGELSHLFIYCFYILHSTVGFHDEKDTILWEEFRSCQHFLVDSELDRTRHKVFNFGIKTSTQKFSPRKLIISSTIKLSSQSESSICDHFEKSWRWKNTLILCTRKQYPAGSIQFCVHQRQAGNAKTISQQNRLHRVFTQKTNIWFARTLFYPEHLSENQTAACFTFQENTRQPCKDNLCRSGLLTLHFNGNQELEEETSKTFILFMSRVDGISFNQFQGVQTNNIVEDLLKINSFLFDIDVLEGNTIFELARRLFRNLKRLSDCWNTIIINVTWLKFMQSCNLFVTFIVTLFSTENANWNDF